MFRKKLVSLLLSSVMVLGAVPLRANAANVMVGDVNADNSISIGDVARLYAHFQGNSLVGQEAMDRADLNGNGWLSTGFTEDLYLQLCEMSPQKILEAYRQLPENGQMGGTVTLSGKIVMINDYNSERNYMSVTIRVDGWEEEVSCYRMPVTSDNFYAACGEYITVTGTLCNYYGCARFSPGCQGVIPRGGCTLQSYMESLVKGAYYLPVNASSKAEVGLLGRVVSVESIAPDASCATINIQVSDNEKRPVRCFRAVGDNIGELQIGQRISVSGILRNSGGIVEFAEGCVMELIDENGFPL